MMIFLTQCFQQYRWQQDILAAVYAENSVLQESHWLWPRCLLQIVVQALEFLLIQQQHLSANKKFIIMCFAHLLCLFLIPT